MLRQKYFYVFLISLSLILTLGCSKQSQIETETGQTNVEKKDQSTNQTLNNQTAHLHTANGGPSNSQDPRTAKLPGTMAVSES